MTITQATLTGREYLRVSQDRSGDGRSPDQQHDDNERAFGERGWRLHSEPYRDENRSASRYATREREDFGRLLADLEAGRFEADALVLWESSRGSRTVKEWVHLLELCEVQGVQIFVTTHGRLYDPANPRDRRTLLEDAVDSEYESAKTSTRIKRNTAATAKAGKPHGKNIYGYVREYDPITRAFLRQVPDPQTADVVREAARRVLAGETCYAVARDFNARDIPPRRQSFKTHRRGLGWTMTAIRQMLEMPAYAGLRVHRGTVVGEALWEPLIPRADWERLQALFATRTRTNDWSARHLLAGIATCGECGAIVRVGKQNAGKRDPETGERKHYNTYVCSGTPGKTGFHVAMRKEHLDFAITEAIIERLGRPDFLAVLGQADQGMDDERARLLAEIEEHRTYLDEVRAMAAEKRRPDLLFDQEERVQPLIREAEARLRRLANTDPLVIDLAQSDNVRKAWEHLDIDEQRRVVRALVVPVIDRIKPENRGKRGVDPSRLQRSFWK